MRHYNRAAWLREARVVDRVISLNLHRPAERQDEGFVDSGTKLNCRLISRIRRFMSGDDRQRQNSIVVDRKKKADYVVR